MSHLRTKSKLNGLYALKGSWVKAMIVVLILSLLSFGLSGLDDAYRNVFKISRLTENGFINIDIRSFAVQAVFSVITFLVMAPLLLGMLEWYWNLTGGKKTGVGDIFAWYGSGRLYGKSLLLSVNIGVRCLLWGILTCGFPSLMIGAANYYLSGIKQQSNLSATDVQQLLIGGLLMIFGVLLLLGGILLFIYITSKYIAAYFLMVEDNSRKVSDVVRDSIKYSRNFKWEFTKFMLSYVGWAIVCIALFPLLYVVPYFNSSLSIFVKHIIYSQRPSVNNADTIRFNAPES